MRISNLFSGLSAIAAAGFSATAALAQDGIDGLKVIGVPEPRGLGFQPAATELARDLQGLDYLVLVIITLITIFVVGLLAIVILRYNKRANPTPATFTHNSPLEIAWTLVPILVLVVIGAFSLPVLFKQQEIPVADVTIKATGYQWYWGYEYVDEGIVFDANMIGGPYTGGDNRMTDEVEAQLVEAGYTKDHFLLATDNTVVVPTGKTIVVQVTAADVIHAWAIPAFGVKQDGVPGRLAELWFEVDEGMEGVYFGQCSELCGQLHSYMPITVKAVTQAEYDAWLVRAADQFAGVPQTVKLAAAN